MSDIKGIDPQLALHLINDPNFEIDENGSFPILFIPVNELIKHLSQLKIPKESKELIKDLKWIQNEIKTMKVKAGSETHIPSPVN